MVRDTLGEDAIIVTTRDENGGPSRGGSVHVTAAIDPDNYTPPSQKPARQPPAFEVGSETATSAPSKDWLQYDEEDENAAVTEEITDAMLRHSVPEDIMDHIISCATVIGLSRPDVALVAALEHLFSFVPITADKANKASMLVGPAGAGKTLAAAKLAAQGVMKNLRVGVITTDTVRAGGIEQLGAFTKLMNIDLHKAANPPELAAALSRLKGCDQIIIDTQGVNPYAQKDMQNIASMIGAAPNIEPILVLPAAGDADESGEMAKIFTSLGVNRLMPTRLDAARRLGGVLAAAHQGSLVFTQASNSPKVSEAFTAMTPESLARLLMPASFPQDDAGHREGGQDTQNHRKAAASSV